ncbi:MAG: hypothetical protein ACJ790_12470 [Myxococcaceae bacterium]
MRENKRRIAIAVALSALIHALVLIGFYLLPVSAPVPPKPHEPVQLTLLTLPPLKKQAPEKIEPTEKSEPVKKLHKSALQQKVAAKDEESRKHEQAQQHASADAPVGNGSNAQLGQNPPDGVMLFPKDLPNGVAVPQGAPSRMHVVHNDPSELPSDEAKKAEEEIRVSQRVNGWMSDDLATIKAQNGGGDPYVDDLREALGKNAEHPPPFKSQGNVLSQAVRTYFEGAAQYGKTGTPYAESIPNNDAAHMTQERSQGTFPDGTTRNESIRNGLYMGGTIKSLANGDSTGVLAIVSITQAPDAKLVSVELIAGSGDADFDKFVLKIAPEALTQLPPFAAGSHPKGLKTEWAFRGKVSYRRHLKDMNFKDDAAYTALTLPMTLLGGGSFEETTGDVQVIDFRHAQYQCSVHLLRIYE